MQRVLLTETSSNEDLTGMFFLLGRRLLEVPEICTCSVGVLRYTAGQDVDQPVMGGVSGRRLLTFADVRAEGSAL